MPEDDKRGYSTASMLKRLFTHSGQPFAYSDPLAFYPNVLINWCRTITGMYGLSISSGIPSMAGRIQIPLTETCLVEQRTSNGTQVACRLCGQMFANSVALVNHIHMHVLRDMVLSRRAGDFSLFQIPATPGASANKLMMQGPSFTKGREDAASPLNQTWITVPPRNPSFASPPLASPDYIFRSRPMALSPIAAMHVEKVGDDGTRPFLYQLDWPIADRTKMALSNGTDSKTGDLSLAPLDLTLKL